MSGQISAVIISFNEEENLERCLKSIADIADEVIVVDSYSSDRTAEICQNHNVRFILREWTDYADQKNFGNREAKYNFILSVDADEEVSRELKGSILKIKAELKCNAYSMNRKSNYAGKWINHSGWYPDRKIRLFNRHHAQWTGPVPHEKLVLAANATVQHLEGDLLHYPFASAQAHLLKAQKYAEMASANLKSRSTIYLLLKLLFSPQYRFIKTFIFQMGFLDGKCGIQICLITSWEVFLKYWGAIKKKVSDAG